MQDPLGPGVREIEHTADVGMVVEAADFAQLLHRAAVGMFALMYGKADADLGPRDAFNPAAAAAAAAETLAEPPLRGDPDVTVRTVTVVGADAAALLLGWLRELLFLHETEGLAYRKADFDLRSDVELGATVGMVTERIPAVCDFKGVTYHELAVTRDQDAWRARVILDV